ncbi:MAG TPA: VCBS repeat-containing protein [Kofleriaceae bacterium]|nr:VCBS repeat-containing protein [Kofleriaceae bacterium]
MKGMPQYLGVVVLACLGLSGCVFYLNPQCNDQIRNGDETDVDCGGGTCGLCNLGDSCRKDSDCDEGTCVGGTCTPLPCANGKLDPGETDVDCGGDTCRRCSGGRQCLVGSDCASGDCVAGAQTCFALATVSFADTVSYPSGNKSYALLSGDLNGDGHVDLVAVNELASSLAVFLGNGTGTFQSMAQQATAYPTGAYPTGGAIADVDHDGIPDVITANYHGDSISVVLGVGSGKGTGALAAPVSYATTMDGETSNLAVGDLNGDGNLDVIAANPAAIVTKVASVSQLMGRADGTFEPAVTAPVGVPGHSQPFSVVMADFDGDGKKDVAIADIYNGPIIVKLGNGDGTFQAESLYPAGGAGATFLLTYDMNLDGKLDLVCANRNSGNVSVLIGRGDGTFRKPIVSNIGPKATDAIGPYSIAVADFNRDGVPDVVTPNSLVSTATVFLGVGDGSFEQAIEVVGVGDHPYGVATGDFNGDGKPDVAISNALSNDMTVKLSTSH